MLKKRSAETNNETGGGWEIVYTGFILILLCFFIMLSSFATMQKSKIAQFVRSFVDAVSVLPSGSGFEENKEIVAPSTEIVDLQDELAKIHRELQKYQTGGNQSLKSHIEIETTREGVVLRLADNALFEIGSARIAADARPLLDEIGSILMKTRLSMRIEGHTDDLPISTREYPSNWELSTARAVTVLRYLLTECSVPAKRLSAAGYGQFQSLVSNQTEENRAKNRRVEIFLLKD
jgi:chemotaxis protein MotB